ncbi:MAG: ammonium transporter [Oscillospiraceae bacterium]|jgi:Amt family ammonium transporter|nr:ammonium transporter [Oscillospiraceae bacterium]
MYSSVDTIWVLLGAVLVFFMQAGFAMVETGLTRAKNAGNIIMKNLMDFALGTLVFWAIGFGIMFAGDGALFGGFDFFIQGDYGVEGSYPSAAFIIFQTVFCATAATIVSGAMAERTKFLSYCVYSVVISTVIYPISGHWIWGGGWLSQLGFHDFAGSTAVHMVGGVAAFVGAAILGPRIGKYDKKKKAKAIPGHSLTLAALGVFILWFCWFGFNGASTVSMTGDAIEGAAKIFVTTNLAAAAAASVVMIVTWVIYKKPDVSMTLNGALAGLVGITAGCDAVSPVGAVCIGAISGVLVIVAVEFIEKVLKVDDPVGAVAVHGVCGAAGTILTGVFALEGGLLYGGGLEMLTVQAIGVGAVMAWVAVTMTVIFFLIKFTIGLRVTKEEETIGLDVEEHGLVSSYADFMPAYATVGADASPAVVSSTAVSPDVAVPVSNNSQPGAKMYNAVIVTKQNRFETLKVALEQIGITGMTVSQVLGFGMQKGSKEYYRGVAVETSLLPKIKVEIVICKVPLQTLVDTVKKALYTGEIGDGKIFIYDVENVIKVRTGEEGYDALQDEE